MILRHSYTRSREVTRAALRYYQLRPRGEGEPPRGLWGKEGAMSRDEAHRLLDTHQARGYLAHRLMLSPSEEERPEDLRAMTYRALRGLERGQGLTLHWVAVEHRNTDQPHVHVALAGGGERDGHIREVRLGLPDHARLKEDAVDYCRREARFRDDWSRALDSAAERLAREGALAIGERDFDR